MEVIITGHKVLIDEEDLHFLDEYSVWATRNHNQIRVYAQKNKVRYEFGRLLMGLEKGNPLNVDHINGKPLDNRRQNLRVCTSHQNKMHRVYSRAKSGYKGVFKTSKYKWRASIGLKGHKRIYLGFFNSPEEAARAYDAAARKYFGEFASPNFPD